MCQKSGTLQGELGAGKKSHMCAHGHTCTHTCTNIHTGGGRKRGDRKRDEVGGVERGRVGKMMEREKRRQTSS